MFIHVKCKIPIKIANLEDSSCAFCHYQNISKDGIAPAKDDTNAGHHYFESKGRVVKLRMSILGLFFHQEVLILFLFFHKT